MQGWIQRQQNTIGKLELLLQDENRLIADFEGATFKVKGEAGKYADDARINIRESYKYRMEAFSNLKESVKAKQANDDRFYTDKLNQMETAKSTAQEYYIKANDAIKKLETLQ